MNKRCKLTELPMGMGYFSDTKELDLTATNVDVIPKKLNGVDIIKVSRIPTYISPDFYGSLYVSKGSGTYEKVIPIQICKSKFTYMQNLDFVESIRYTDAGVLEVISLPPNMSFYEKNGKTYLDLSKTTIEKLPIIDGVDQVIMPVDRFRRYLPRILYPKTKVHG